MSTQDPWISARSRTLILSGDRAGTPYFREDFLNGLKLVLGDGISQIVSFGPLAKNTEWFLMVKSERARDNLLAAGVVKVRGGVLGCGPPTAHNLESVYTGHRLLFLMM